VQSTILHVNFTCIDYVIRLLIFVQGIVLAWYWIGSLSYTGCSKKTVPRFYFCDNFRKWAPILTFFFIYDA